LTLGTAPSKLVDTSEPFSQKASLLWRFTTNLILLLVVGEKSLAETGAELLAAISSRRL